jgi:hypothetical protein
VTPRGGKPLTALESERAMADANKRGELYEAVSKLVDGHGVEDVLFVLGVVLEDLGDNGGNARTVAAGVAVQKAYSVFARADRPLVRPPVSDDVTHPRSSRCPVCKAPAGFPCRADGSRPVKGGWVHVARVDAAKRLQRASQGGK